MSQKPRVRIVLDTSCLRGTPLSVLEALNDKFAIHLSGVALMEIAARVITQGAILSADSIRLRRRLRVLHRLLGEHPSFAPSHGPLIDKLGGTTRGRARVPHSDWLEETARVWAALVSPDEELPGDVVELLQRMASYVDEISDRFVATARALASLGKLASSEIALTRRLSRGSKGLLEHINLPKPATAHDRFDAYARMLEYHGEIAYDRAAGMRPAHEENDALDLNILQHLAEGLVIVTSDYRLVEDVDDSGSRQAPWVRVAGELLLSKIPPGPPFGARAKMEIRRHRRRKRIDLHAIDRAAIEHAKPRRECEP